MLGIVAMICAPALLVEAVITIDQGNHLVVGIASMVFMFGWICSNTAMRRLRAAGTGRWGRAVLLVQLVGLVLAFASGFFEATGLFGRGDTIFDVADSAWPLSMIWMFLPVGVSTILAGRPPGWRGFVPMLCGSWLPLSFALPLFGGSAVYVGFGMAAVFWLMLDLVLRNSEERIQVAPQPAVR
jgi:hypothetical protein